MDEDIVSKMLRMFELQEQHMMNIEERFTKMLEQSEARLNDVHSMIDKLSTEKHEQTGTFVMQINKLSSRLDEAVAAVARAQQAQIDEGKRADRILQILHDATRKGDTNTNTYNNM